MILKIFMVMGALNFALNSLASAAKPDFYVSPNGNDHWSGRMAAPNARKDDGPFATLQHAILACRSIRTVNHTPIIAVRGGEYFLNSPITLYPEDSRLEVINYNREKPIFSGGTPIRDWKVASDGVWETVLPGVKEGAWDFCQLFVNNQRRYRPRLPENGYYYIKSSEPSTPDMANLGSNRFQFHKGDINPNWEHLKEVEVLVFQNWTMSRFNIKSVDPATDIVTVNGHTQGNSGWAEMPTGNRYIVENVKEALKRPGQWYLDKESGVLSYIPMPGEKPGNTQVIAPVLDQLLIYQGDPTKGEFVRDVTIQGLSFEHSNWVMGGGGQSFPQSEINLSGAIYAIGARNCTLSNCTVEHTGGYGVEFGMGCQDCVIERSQLLDLGAGGVKLGVTDILSNPNEIALHNKVYDCLIAHGGRLHPAGCGIWIGQSPDNIINHNEIEDFYYTGISVGWTWGYDTHAMATGNLIEYNLVHDIGQGVLSDMGGIYTLGLQTGTVIRNNIFHDINCYVSGYGGWGIYFDEGTTNILAKDNLVYNAYSGGLHQHYGMNNRVTNNIFAFATTAQLIRTRAEDHLSFTFDHNIVYWNKGPLLGGNWSGDEYKLDYNDYWDESGAPVTFAGNTWEQWRAKGEDIHSLIADPEFVNPNKYDFRLKPGSPALSLGFKPFDISKAGRLGHPVPEKVKHPAFPTFPGPRPPQSISQGFEDLPVGSLPMAGANVYEENSQATIRVSDDKAASGSHSLKFTDAPGQIHRYDPFMYYSPDFTNGALEGSFDYCPEPGAILNHEWRNDDNPYKVGPSLHFDENGWVYADGKRLVQLPMNEFSHIDIRCGLGAKADAKWSLTITPPDKRTYRYENLSCDPKFKTLNWFGFSSDADAHTVFYIDNIQLSPVP